jgi:L-asparagine transporter-like permease
MKIKANFFYFITVFTILILVSSNLGLVLLLLGQRIFWIVVYGLGITGVWVWLTLLDQKQSWKADAGPESGKRLTLKHYFPFLVMVFFHFLVLVIRWGTLKVPTDSFYPELLFAGQGLLLLSLYFLGNRRFSKVGDFFFRLAIYALGYIGLSVSLLVTSISPF